MARGQVTGLLLLLAAACGPRPARFGGPPLPPPIATTGPSIHDIDPGVLRGLLIEGELRVTPDEGTLAAMRSAKQRRATVAVSVCLDVDGTPTIGIKRMSPFRAYNNAVSAALATWRFRPYVRDGSPAQACSTASFTFVDAAQLTPGAAPPPVGDALPAAAIELPLGRIDTGSLPRDNRVGRISSVSILASSGYLGYDADLLNGVATWRYQPFLVDGEPVAVCTKITFIYRQLGCVRSC